MIDSLPTDCWYTPDYIIDCVDEFFVSLWQDPCPINPEYDARSSYWWGDVFINPPYSPKLRGEIIRNGSLQYRNAKQRVVPNRFLWLVNFANSKDCKILSNNASAICIPYKRIDFIPGHPSLKAGSPRYDSIFYLWGNPMGFADAFKSVGKVYADPLESIL